MFKKNVADLTAKFIEKKDKLVQDYAHEVTALKVAASKNIDRYNEVRKELEEAEKADQEVIHQVNIALKGLV